MTSGATRRAVLLGAAGVALSGCGVDVVPGKDPDPRISGSFVSAAMGGKKVGWTLAYPKRHGPGDHLPVVVSLHGRRVDHRFAFDTLKLGDVLDEVVADGVAPFVFASLDGGDHSYWHRRADGTDAGGAVLEFIAMLGGRGLDVTRIGLYGWSMGGYGALLLAGRRHIRVRGVAVSSPALFTSAGGTSPGAFDSADDFTAHDVYAHPEWVNFPLRVDCGLQDPFYEATRTFVDEVSPHPGGGFRPGAHDPAYWRKVAPAQLRFLGSRLA